MAPIVVMANSKLLPDIDPDESSRIIYIKQGKSVNNSKMQTREKKVTMSFGEEAAWMNQSWVRKSWIDRGSGWVVPGYLRKNPWLEPKYCHDSAESRSKLFENNGSKWEDHATEDWRSKSENFNIF